MVHPTQIHPTDVLRRAEWVDHVRDASLHRSRSTLPREGMDVPLNAGAPRTTPLIGQPGPVPAVYPPADPQLPCLSALLAAHLFAARNQRPIRRFLRFDRPTQVYFTSDQVDRDADGSTRKTETAADGIAVGRLLDLLCKSAQEDEPGLQLIVTEHANLHEQWRQDALAEQSWTRPPSLVQQHWPQDKAS